LFSIEYDSVKGHLNYGLLWRDRFQFSYNQLKKGQQITVKNIAFVSKTKLAGVRFTSIRLKKFLLMNLVLKLAWLTIKLVLHISDELENLD